MNNILSLYIVDIAHLGDNSPEDRKLWGIFSSFESAESAILTDLDMFEEFYNLAIIEECSSCLNEHSINIEYPTSTEHPKWWYLAKFSPNEELPVIVKISS